jgi:hypothetical protein
MESTYCTFAFFYGLNRQIWEQGSPYARIQAMNLKLDMFFRLLSSTFEMCQSSCLVRRLQDWFIIYH